MTSSNNFSDKDKDLYTAAWKLFLQYLHFNLFTFFIQYSDINSYSSVIDGEVETNLSHEVYLIYASVAHSVIHMSIIKKSYQ